MSGATAAHSPTSSLPDKDKFAADEARRESVMSPGPSAVKDGDAALEVLGGDGTKRHQFSEEEDRKVLRKIDLWVMPVVLMVYFLQQLDKSSISYASVFGLVQDTHLVGTQYSWLTSIVYLAQLVWQPMSSYMLVRFPLSKYLFVHVLAWGIIVASTAAAHNFAGLLTARFFLGIFEATVAPCFITITQMWWRRREQTLRLAMWFTTNAVTGVVGSLVTYGLGHIRGSIKSYQIIFLFIGVLTMIVSPIVYFVLPDSPATAKFLTREEKIIAVERLRANNQGTESKVWKWSQVGEVLIDPKTYLWFLLLFVCCVPSGGISAFGPLIINGFGFNQFQTILFNIPFNALQIVSILFSAWISTRLKLKWPVIIGVTIPPVVGSIALLCLGRGPELRDKLLGCYYVISVYTSIQPMLYAWSAQNTAGHTKKLCNTGIIFVAQCAGNVVGPLLYKTEDKPYYRNGLIADVVCWAALIVLTLITAAYLAFLNRRHAQRRVRAGKKADVVDTSLEVYKVAAQSMASDDEKHDGTGLNDRAFDDLTDMQNEDFIYVL